MKIISFLAAGRGSNFYAVAQAMLQQDFPGKPGILITSRKDAGAIDLAKDLNFPAAALSWKELGGQEGFEQQAIHLLDQAGTDLVVCAGYMKILSNDFVRKYKHRMINIHPSLLPAFPGIHSQKQALDYGVKVTGCTTHFVDEGVDTGPIIMQASVPVLDDDTEDDLGLRILENEHKILVESVRLFCEEKLVVQGRRVFIKNK